VHHQTYLAVTAPDNQAKRPKTGHAPAVRLAARAAALAWANPLETGWMSPHVSSSDLPKLSDAARQALLRALFSRFDSRSISCLPSRPRSRALQPRSSLPLPTFTRPRFRRHHRLLRVLAGKSIEDVRAIAIAKTRHPVHRPYIIGDQQIAALLAQLGFVVTVYKEIERVADIPDVALVMGDSVPEMDVGRHSLFHRLSLHQQT
jgi:hypothetical protein